MAKLPTQKKYAPKMERGYGDIAADIGRAAAQGLTFGLSDEIYGAYKAFTSDKTYEEAAQEIRDGLKRFRETDPVKAYGFEILGSLLTGGAGAAAAKLGAKTAGAVGGAIYGGATGETPEGRIAGAAIGAPIGLAGAKIGEAITPVASEAAKSLLRRGYQLTPGQTYGGIPKSMEEKMSLPFVSEIVKQQQEKTMQQFNRETVDRAVSPLNISLPKNLQGEDLVEAASEAVSEAYENVVPRLSIDASGLSKKIDEIATAKGFNDVDKKEFASIVNDIALRNIKDGRLAKQTLKDVETDLTSEVFNTTRKGGRDARIGRAVKDFRDSLRQEITKQNPDVPELQSINKAFSMMKPIEAAKDRVVARGGVFGPTQYLSQKQIKALPPTAPEKAAAREVRDVIGPTIGSSQSTERYLASTPVGFAMGAALSPLAALGYKTGIGRGMLRGGTGGRGLMQLPGGLTRRAAPAVGGLLSQEAPSLVSQAQASSLEDMAAGGNIVGYESGVDRQGNPFTFAKMSDGRAVRVR